MAGAQDPKMQLVYGMRSFAVEFGLLGEAFAKSSALNGTDLRAIIEMLDASRAGVTATPGWLSERLSLNSASTTALVDRLERMGHVRRARDTADRRRVHLTLTPAAVNLGWSFFGPVSERLTDAMDMFAASDLVIVDRFLHAMIDATRNQEDVS